MIIEPRIETHRLVLRRWRKEDLKPFAALNADPDVMEHFPGPMTEADTARLIARIEIGFEENGFGLWAVEVAWARAFIGFCGLSVPSFEAPFMPAVEVGWRLSREHWGSGYATEAAAASLDFGFDRVGLDEIVSFTVPQNTRSRGVMERLGMTHDESDDFDHPRVLEDPRLRRHVLYRITSEAWASQRGELGI